MAQRTSFAEMRAAQAKMTESWKAEGRLSEAWVVADAEIVEIFSAGVAFGIEVGRRGRGDPAYFPNTSQPSSDICQIFWGTFSLGFAFGVGSKRGRSDTK